MNFARYKCDRRAMQSLMREGAFSLQVRNKSLAAAPGALILLWRLHLLDVDALRQRMHP
jgi:hypothetical protein